MQISHDIVQLVGSRYRARIHPVTLVVFFQVTKKGWNKVKLDNKSRCLIFDSPYGLVEIQHNS